jgi:hypothetical protein
MGGGATPNKADEILYRKPPDFACHREARLVMLGGEAEDQRINVTVSWPAGLIEMIQFDR